MRRHITYKYLTPRTKKMMGLKRSYKAEDYGDTVNDWVTKHKQNGTLGEAEDELRQARKAINDVIDAVDDGRVAAQGIIGLDTLNANKDFKRFALILYGPLSRMWGENVLTFIRNAKKEIDKIYANKEHLQ